jgi:hypothetical protein
MVLVIGACPGERRQVHHRIHALDGNIKTVRIFESTNDQRRTVSLQVRGVAGAADQGANTDVSAGQRLNGM